MKEHKPVLLKEVLEIFSDVKIERFFDGTLGAGGHAKALLQNHPEIKMYIACDKDIEAIEIAKKNLKKWDEKIVYIHADFVNLDKHIKEQNIKNVNGFFLTWGCHLCN